jgi:hypothetical protein
VCGEGGAGKRSSHKYFFFTAISFFRNTFILRLEKFKKSNGYYRGGIGGTYTMLGKSNVYLMHDRKMRKRQAANFPFCNTSDDDT